MPTSKVNPLTRVEHVELCSAIFRSSTNLAFAQISMGIRLYWGAGPIIGEINIRACDNDIVVIQLTDHFWGTLHLDGSYHLEVQAGNAILIPHGTKSRWQCMEGWIDALIVVLPKDLCQKFAVYESPADFKSFCLRPQITPQDPLLRSIAATLISLSHAPHKMERAYVELLVATLVTHIVRTYGTFELKDRRHEAMLPKTVLEFIINYIDANLDHELSLDELGEVASYSPFYLARLFRSTIGQSVHQYVISRRLERAKHLLETTERPTRQIALEVGFADFMYFNRQFRRRFFYPPNAIRSSQWDAGA